MWIDPFIDLIFRALLAVMAVACISVVAIGVAAFLGALLT